jgi:ankyrin repeat protein
MEPDGRTALHIAAARTGAPAQAACELLIARGADVNGACKGGYTPLLAAVEANSPSMMKWLLTHGADARQLCGSEWGAIHLAVRLGLESCVLALLQHDDGLKAQEDGQGFTPLATAAEVGAEQIALLLLDRGADVNQAGAPETRRITALMVATYHKRDAMVKLLLEHGAGVNMQDANGHTPLHIASLLNEGGLIPPLLHAGADTALRDNSGRTAEQLATDKSSDEVLRQFAVLAHA